MSKVVNRVTETAKWPEESWIVSTTWRGGHNNRPFLLENVFRTEKEALAEVKCLLPNPHNYKDYGPVKLAKLTRSEDRVFTND